MCGRKQEHTEETHAYTRKVPRPIRRSNPGPCCEATMLTTPNQFKNIPASPYTKLLCLQHKFLEGVSNVVRLSAMRKSQGQMLFCFQGTIISCVFFPLYWFVFYWLLETKKDKLECLFTGANLLYGGFRSFNCNYKWKYGWHSFLVNVPF